MNVDNDSQRSRENPLTGPFYIREWQTKTLKYNFLFSYVSPG